MSDLVIYDEDEEQVARDWFRANYLSARTSKRDRTFIRAIHRNLGYIAQLIASVENPRLPGKPSADEIMKALERSWHTEDLNPRPSRCIK